MASEGLGHVILETVGSEVWCCASAGVALASPRLATWSVSAGRATLGLQEGRQELCLAGKSSGGPFSTALQQCLDLRLLFKTVVNSISRIAL